jgi:ferredoxin-nitrate reductase
LSEKRSDLLRSGKKRDPLIGKLVCSCAGVGEGNIINKINEGYTEIKSLNQACGTGVGCGSCKPEVLEILKKQLAKLEEEEMLQTIRA